MNFPFSFFFYFSWALSSASVDIGFSLAFGDLILPALVGWQFASIILGDIGNVGFPSSKMSLVQVIESC
jgi:hypothetical protein